MIDTNIILNTCYETTKDLRVVASYSHIIPVLLSLLLAIFVFIKSKFNLFSKIFLTFVSTFSIWLIGDFLIWTSNNYHLIYAIWSPLDFIEMVFYALGLYFVMVFVKKSDVSKYIKIGLFLVTLPAFFITITLHSVTGFNYPQCEAFNNDFLGQYKLIVEAIILAVILFYTVVPFIKKLSWKEKKTNLVMLGSMFLFLSVFGVTEYLASATGNYELNLYSLFLLPLFLVAIIYSVFELDIFNFKILGTYYLIWGLIILMGGQLFFVNGSTDQLLTVITLIFTIGLSYVLYRNLKKESDQRVHIEKLSVDLQNSKLRLEETNIKLGETNDSLQNTIRQRESLVHLVTHKVKGSFTRSKYIFAEMIDGTFGPLSDVLKSMAVRGLASDNDGIDTVDLVLNAANLQSGTIKYDMKPINFKDVVTLAVQDKVAQAETKGLKLINKIKDGDYSTLGDIFWLKEVVHNLIDNSEKYTPAGSIEVDLEKKNDKILLTVKDTGIGITEEDKANLFKEGGRGKDSIKVNVDSTGYGLYTVKLIVEAHKGRVWAESEGTGKGSAFYVELPVNGINTEVAPK